MVTISIGSHSSAYGKAVWMKGNYACIKIGDRMVQGRIIRSAPPKSA